MGGAPLAYVQCLRLSTPASLPLCPAPQFKDHLKKAEAISEFAKNKSIAEQRRFLPVYSVREEMLQVGGGRAPAWSSVGRGPAGLAP